MTVRTRTWRPLLAAALGWIGGAVVLPATLLAHHSFAMYDQTATKTMTGKLFRFVPGSNHAQLGFYVVKPDGTLELDAEGNPLRWGVELGAAVAIARQGITAKSFPVGTIFTVTLYPLRDGRPHGAVAGQIIKCGMELPAGGCTRETGQAMNAPAN
jgi:hypothetical protein